MNLTGTIKNIQRDFISGKWNITFEINENLTEEINPLSECEKLSIDVKKHRNKRSLDANSYAWVLMQKISEAIHSDKWSVYLNMLETYSRQFTFVICTEKAVGRLKELYRACVDLGEITVNGKKGHQVQVYYGSSTFDSKDMAVFIDGIVRECKELGIETMTPDEIERIKSEWQK